MTRTGSSAGCTAWTRRGPATPSKGPGQNHAEDDDGADDEADDLQQVV